MMCVASVLVTSLHVNTSATLESFSCKYRYHTKCCVTTACYDSGVAVMSLNQSPSSFISSGENVHCQCWYILSVLEFPKWSSSQSV